MGLLGHKREPAIASVNQYSALRSNLGKFQENERLAVGSAHSVLASV